MRGITALGRAGECPKCGCKEDTVMASGQKLGAFPIVTDKMLEDPDLDKYEILLETDGVTIKTIKKKGAEQ